MSEVEIIADQPIAAYNEFRAQLAALEKSNSNAVFDYEDAGGNKDARSHIFKLRKTKTAVDRVRKDQKQASLDYGRKVDSEAKEIISKVEEMIEVHAKPIKLIEQREESRKAAIEEKYDHIVGYGQLAVSVSSSLITGYISDLKKMEPDDSFDEYMAESTREFKRSMQYLNDALKVAITAEKEKAELEKLRAENAKREQEEREAQIAKEAAEKAESEARTAREAEKRAIEQAAEAVRQREAAEIQAKKDAKEAEERRVQAAARAIEDARLAAENARREAEAKAVRDAEEAARLEQEETAKREANKKHKAGVNNKAVDALVSGGVSKTAAKDAIRLIAKRKIPGVSISY